MLAVSVFVKHAQSVLWRIYRLNCSAPLRTLLTMGYILQAILAVIAFSTCLYAQTASTGALTGKILDPSGSLVRGAEVRLIFHGSENSRSCVSDVEGNFHFALLAPGSYDLRVSKTGFAQQIVVGLDILVTETSEIDLQLKVGTVAESVDVSSEPSSLQTNTVALGRVVSQTAVTSLPLVTRNFAQITDLSPGVVTGVSNAGELGSGGTALSQIDKSNDGLFVHGARSYDNNFELDGISVSDVQGSASASGGIPIPNPDAIQEFKVQTGLYDASYGRYGGANISVVTKSGTDAYHGSIFEFVRNDVLNANDFFLNRTGQPRPPLQQNQFGFDVGGPIKRNKLFFFGSYQGTRQLNALASGQARTGCTVSLSSPPITNDRSAAALGQLFGGLKGALGGVAIQPDGSNINPVAFELLNFKLPDGSFLIPTPQTVNSTNPFASQGFSTLSQPCHYNEDQFLINADYVASSKSRFSFRSLWTNTTQAVTFPGNGLNKAGNLPGFPSNVTGDFRIFSLSNTYALSSRWLNQARFGFVRTVGNTTAQAPFTWSDLGVSAGAMNNENELVSLNVTGSISFASGFPRQFAQNSYVITDDLTYVSGKHTIQVGGSLTRFQDNIAITGIGSFVQFLSWPDFLLGMSATQNGTNRFSNVFQSVDDYGLLNREYRAWEGSAYAQDNYQVTDRLMLSLGLRYERLGQFGDQLGRNSSFDFSKADPNPPPQGSTAGYIVASNYPGNIPAGVIKAGNTFANNATGQNTLAPRIGFAWQVLPNVSHILLRGGYGLYYSRPTGQTFFQSAFGAPFSEGRFNVGQTNASATFQAPFPQPFPTPDSFPLFPAYSPSTAITVSTVSPDFRPAMIQQFGLNVQAEIRSGLLFEIGYVGTRGTHLMRDRLLNQALDASTNSPIRGQSDNTLANIPLRVPIVGIASTGLQQIESAGDSWYNGLEVSLTKRFSRGFQFLASYTFAKSLDTDGANINGTSAGNTFTRGDQNSPGQRWGRSSFDRPNRFVLSIVYALPNSYPKGFERLMLGGWSLAAVGTLQSGDALTIIYTNSTNVFGISQDRVQLSGACKKGQLVTSGSEQSKLNDYFNRACFTTPPIIGADGIGTAFGDSATGIVNGPGQANLDLSLTRTIPLRWPQEGSGLEFRLEFFNIFNHPQFADPDNNFSSATFGVISSTSVSPRVGQLALKLSF
jgi:Carboxypeptidase regulatory-like domain/TonB dependent receptor